jgi:hypothetical protein
VAVTVIVIMGDAELAEDRVLTHCCTPHSVIAPGGLSWLDIADSAALHTFYAYHCAIDVLFMRLGQYRDSHIGPEMEV